MGLVVSSLFASTFGEFAYGSDARRSGVGRRGGRLLGQPRPARRRSRPPMVPLRRRPASGRGSAGRTTTAFPVETAGAPSGRGAPDKLWSANVGTGFSSVAVAAAGCSPSAIAAAHVTAWTRRRPRRRRAGRGCPSQPTAATTNTAATSVRPHNANSRMWMQRDC